MRRNDPHGRWGAGGALSPLAFAALLAHCSLETSGLASGDAGQAGVPPVGGAGGGNLGDGDASGGAGRAAGGAGGAGVGGGSGGNDGGAAGVGGGGGGGGGTSPCDAAKGEFAVPNAPASCFFFLAEGARQAPPSSRARWSWPQAVEDCQALASRLASLAAPAEYEGIREAIGRDRGDGLAIGGSVWIGARTEIVGSFDQIELARSFFWQASDEAWVYDEPGVAPWSGGEPSINFDFERCVETRADDGHRMNNLRCDRELSFALCERDVPPASTGRRAR